jgi:hypothetical protein
MAKSIFQILDRRKIEAEKWNRVVQSSDAPIYHYTWFLDQMRTRWIGLVERDQLGNYSSIFPLQLQLRFGIKFICQNPFFPHNGTYQTHPNHPRSSFSTFVKSFLSKQSYIQKLVLPSQNFGLVDNGNSATLLNYRLSIANGYAQTLKGFSTNRLRNLKVAMKTDLAIIENHDIDSYIYFHDTNTRAKIVGMEKHQYRELTSLFQACQIQSKACIAWVVRAGNPVAAAIMLFEKETITYFSASTNPKGRDFGASTFLIAELIRKYCKTYSYIDFNGGRDVESMNRFYESFGAAPEHLFALKKIAFSPLLASLFFIRRNIISAARSIYSRCIGAMVSKREGE